MIFSKLLDRDSLLLGIIAGMLLPVPAILILGSILMGIQHFFHFALNFRQIDIILLSLATNLILARYYFLTRNYEKTGRGLIVITFICVIVFFAFLRNINLSLSF